MNEKRILKEMYPYTNSHDQRFILLYFELIECEFEQSKQFIPFSIMIIVLRCILMISLESGKSEVGREVKSILIDSKNVGIQGE